MQCPCAPDRDGWQARYKVVERPQVRSVFANVVDVAVDGLRTV